MLLTLTYTSTNRLHCSAAIIKGGSPSVWLAQISQWGIGINDADYFIVPQSIESAEAAALFLVFKNAETAKQLNIIHPYGQAGAGLYIPVNALLYPEVSEQDLKQALLWKFQLYNPTIGLVGFEDSDKTNPGDWIDYGRSITKSWNFAHEGLAPVPPLRLIQVQPPSAKDVLEDMKNSIHQKPLTDIPVKKTRTEIEKIADTVKEALARGTLYALRRLRNLFNIIENSGSGVAQPEKEGYLDKAEKKLEAIIANLEELRQKEIERLLKMFEDGNDEALQYAIPLDSQYLNRGNTNTQDWKLTRRTTGFNLGGLGGGNKTNVWQLENNQYESLRTKYLNAARREIEKGDFKKAAYIYAYLMADYNSAANVLEQGRFYREAAALYKDHLKNLPAAAECLERGGLALDAIEVYKELQRDEKVGDLYSSIGQQENAKKYYHLYIDKKLHQTDYLDAARVAGEKLNDANQAKDILMNGWNNFNRAEDCLKKYFDIEASENNTESSVKDIYSNHTPPEKRKFFINVLEYVNKKYFDPQLLNTARTIAYEIISREVVEKNYTVVKQLKSFFPDDRLIASDSSRFLSRHEQQFKAPDKFVLNADINWIKAIAHRNQFIAFGFKDKTLRMARGNWYGNIEYYFWNTRVELNINIPLIANPLFSDNIIVSVHGITLKELFKNKYFSEVLKIDNPAGIANSDGNYAINNKQEICRLAMENENLTLFYYTISGKLSESIHCVCDKQDYPIEHLDYLHNGSLIWHLEYFYGHNSKAFFSISEKGIAKTLLSDAGIRYITTYPHKEKLLLVASTNSGCVAGEAQHGTFKFFTDNYFARDVVPIDMMFVSSSVFVISRNNTLHIYEYNEGHPRIKSVMETDGRILSLMKTSTTNQIAVLTDNKKITIVNIG